MPTIFSNLKGGTLSADPGLSGTTLNSAAFASLDVVASPNTMWVTLDPEGVNGAPEIVLVTTHTSSATSCTVTRAQQSTTARAHPIGTVWVVSVTKSDLDELPFRKMSARGDLIRGGATPNTTTRLPLGAANTVLRSDGTDPLWGKITNADIDASAAVAASKLDPKLSRGVVARAVRTAPQPGITGTTDLTGLSVGFTAEADRLYRIEAHTGVVGWAAGDLGNLIISTGAGTQLQARGFRCNDNTNPIGAEASVTVEPGAGSVTYKARIEVVSSAGTLFSSASATAPAELVVYDVGEA